jgi:hypothetical protein
MRWFESSYPSLLETSIKEFAGVAELADALDSKSSVFTDVPVRPRPPVSQIQVKLLKLDFSGFLLLYRNFEPSFQFYI